jgi:hypothetical protein
MAASQNTIGWIVLLVAAGFVLVRLVRRTAAKRRAGGDSGGNGDFSEDYSSHSGRHGHDGGHAGDAGGDGGQLIFVGALSGQLVETFAKTL